MHIAEMRVSIHQTTASSAAGISHPQLVGLRRSKVLEGGAIYPHLHACNRLPFVSTVLLSIGKPHDTFQDVVKQHGRLDWHVLPSPHRHC